MNTKRCGKCTRDLPLSAFSEKKTEGRLQCWCRQCNAYDCANRRKQATAKPTYVPNPLNLILRDMPGNRGQLLGIPGARMST